jgi:Holliday junction resolvase RusA-like endonuclease/NTP pyrophosphatase (non-canonical NTP hydrolase)
MDTVSFSFSVPGKPQQKGSKQAFARMGKNGRPFATLVDSNKEAMNHQNWIKACALAEVPLDWERDGPVKVSISFYFQRPKSHMLKSGELRKGAPEYHVSKPDIDKLVRTVLDGLTGVFFHDDSQVEVYFYGKATEMNQEPTSPSPETRTWDDRVRKWAADRNLIDGSNPRQQFGKLTEEVNELSEAIHEMEIDNLGPCGSDSGYCAMQDAIGDIAVVLQVIASQIGTTLTECQELAWQEIKDRRGKMVDGVFVKDA